MERRNQLCAHRRSIRPWTSEEQERGEEEGRREEKKKSRTGKRGKTAHVALLSSSRSCLILVRPTPLIACCASASSLLHDAVMCSMERHSTITRFNYFPLVRQCMSELVATGRSTLPYLPGT